MTADAVREAREALRATAMLMEAAADPAAQLDATMDAAENLARAKALWALEEATTLALAMGKGSGIGEAVAELRRRIKEGE